MNDNNIKELSNDMIFSSVEKEASSSYNLKVSMFNTNNYNFNVETFSNHSFTKSITLFYCFEQLKNTNKEFSKVKNYLRYISNNLNYIDLTKFETNWGYWKIKNILHFVLLIYFEDRKNLKEALDFMFDILFHIIESKNEKAITKFIEAICSNFCLTEDTIKIVNECKKHNLQDTLFLSESVICSNVLNVFIEMLPNRKLLWDGIFNYEKFIPFYSDQSDLNEYLKQREKDFNCIDRYNNSYLEKMNEIKKNHYTYLNDIKQFFKLINKKNKDKYLENFKKNGDVFSYILISTYLSEAKSYIKKELKNEY